MAGPAAGSTAAAAALIIALPLTSYSPQPVIALPIGYLLEGESIGAVALFASGSEPSISSDHPQRLFQSASVS